MIDYFYNIQIMGKVIEKAPVINLYGEILVAVHNQTTRLKVHGAIHDRLTIGDDVFVDAFKDGVDVKVKRIEIMRSNAVRQEVTESMGW